MRRMMDRERMIDRFASACLVFAYILAVVAGLLIGALPKMARSHGDADWIRRGGYTNENGEWCCGRQDCESLTATQVQESRYGFFYDFKSRFDNKRYSGAVPQHRVQRSEDRRFWICMVNGRVRCFFAPANLF